MAVVQLCAGQLEPRLVGSSLSAALWDRHIEQCMPVSMIVAVEVVFVTLIGMVPTKQEKLVGWISFLDIS